MFQFTLFPNIVGSMHLKDIPILTLQYGKMTTARRLLPIPQLKCVGGTAGCSAFTPKVHILDK